MSKPDPSINQLSQKIATLEYIDLLPHNKSSQNETRQFLQKVADILIDYIELCLDRVAPVLGFHQPWCLKEKFDMHIPENGLPLSQLIDDCTKALKHQVKSGHPRLMSQLSTDLDIFSMAAEWLTATSNSNTFEISPAFNMMEHTLLEKMRRLIGFKSGESVLAPAEPSPTCTQFFSHVSKCSQTASRKDLHAFPEKFVFSRPTKVITVLEPLLPLLALDLTTALLWRLMRRGE